MDKTTHKIKATVTVTYKLFFDVVHEPDPKLAIEQGKEAIRCGNVVFSPENITETTIDSIELNDYV